ncbi:hypothetical protein ATPR_1342 [Acetobacter tropicalis NBRC 101654]|uniref:Uncharacterized protein n=1 Tax=Acetobacter tropicalis NBRC 101654 TaxID=749388 RepID=F7VD93_9PROT|nr:hypothetical protein ATPR_1342 [Acetobacter tropicalis NBRC 101654]
MVCSRNNNTFVSNAGGTASRLRTTNLPQSRMNRAKELWVS